MCLWTHVFIGQDRGMAMVPFDFRHIEQDLLEEDDGSTSLMNKKIFEILAVEWLQIQTSSDHIYPELHRWSPNSSRSEQCKDSWILNPQHIKTAHAMSPLHYLLVPSREWGNNPTPQLLTIIIKHPIPPIPSFPTKHQYDYTGWCPPVTSWFINPMNTIVISAINHSYGSYVHQLI